MLVPLDHPALRRKAEPAQIGPSTNALIKKLRKTLKGTTGVGIAAPQIGESIQVFLLDVPNNPKTTPRLILNGKSTSLADIRPLAVINPEIQCEGETKTEEEGCLSLPGTNVPVPRTNRVTLKFLNEDGQLVTLETQGFLARVIQHEFDHLQGKLITDFQKPALSWDHPTWFPVRCPTCGWQGMSNETAGGEPIPESGDYDDPVCPKCIEENKWIPVVDIPKPTEP